MQGGCDGTGQSHVQRADHDSNPDTQALKLKEGDKVFFLEEKGRIIVLNAAQVALETFQDAMAGEAAKAGFSTEDDVVRYIKELRTGSGT